MNEEEWRPVPGYEGRYEISNFGNVRSVRRNRLMVLTTIHGYHHVNLSKCGKATMFRVHRLVAEAFLRRDSSRPHVNHKDGVKTNNHAPNLEWCTPGENNQHAISLGLRAVHGSKNGFAKLNEKQVRVIAHSLKIGLEQTYLGSVFKVKNTTIHQISKGNTWKRVTADIL